MGLPALLFPDSPVTPPLIAPEAMQSLQTEMKSLLADVRLACPAEGSIEETAVLMRLMRLSMSTYRLLQTSFLEVLRQNLHHALSELVRKELATAEVARRLALRHIGKAVDAYGVLMEGFAVALRSLPSLAVAMIMDEFDERITTMGEVPMEDNDRIVLRFQLDVMVALDVLDASLEELTKWAFRAITSARQVEALPIGALSSQIRGDLARVRSRHAWVDWDDEQVAREFAPWPNTSR